MTEAELDETKAMPPSRIIRIAKGSGHYPHEVFELLEQFKLMQTTMQKTMKKNKKMGKGHGLAQHGRCNGGSDDAQDEPADAGALGRPTGPRANDAGDGEG